MYLPCSSEFSACCAHSEPSCRSWKGIRRRCPGGSPFEFLPLSDRLFKFSSAKQGRPRCVWCAVHRTTLHKIGYGHGPQAAQLNKHTALLRTCHAQTTPTWTNHNTTTPLFLRSMWRAGVILWYPYTPNPNPTLTQVILRVPRRCTLQLVPTPTTPQQPMWRVSTAMMMPAALATASLPQSASPTSPGWGMLPTAAEFPIGWFASGPLEGSEALPPPPFTTVVKVRHHTPPRLQTATATCTAAHPHTMRRRRLLLLLLLLLIPRA